MRVADSLIIPDEVERARQAGELVIFAGAGVSIDPPASMPDFVALGRQIAEGRIGWERRTRKSAVYHSVYHRQPHQKSKIAQPSQIARLPNSRGGTRTHDPGIMSAVL